MGSSRRSLRRRNLPPGWGGCRRRPAMASRQRCGKRRHRCAPPLSVVLVLTLKTSARLQRTSRRAPLLPVGRPSFSATSLRRRLRIACKRPTPALRTFCVSCATILLSPCVSSPVLLSLSFSLCVCFSPPLSSRHSFAGRWAAKEATIKAISSSSPDSKPVWKGAAAPLIDIEVVPSSSGAPVVNLSGHAKDVAAMLGLSSFTVSISHTSTVAIAQASAE